MVIKRTIAKQDPSVLVFEVAACDGQFGKHFFLNVGVYHTSCCTEWIGAMFCNRWHMLFLNTALLGWQQLGKVTPNHCLYSSAFQHCSRSLHAIHCGRIFIPDYENWSSFWNKVWKIPRCWRMSKIILMFTVSPPSEMYGLNVNFVPSVSGTYPKQICPWLKEDDSSKWGLWILYYLILAFTFFFVQLWSYNSENFFLLNFGRITGNYSSFHFTLYMLN